MTTKEKVIGIVALTLSIGLILIGGWFTQSLFLWVWHATFGYLSCLIMFLVVHQIVLRILEKSVFDDTPEEIEEDKEIEEQYGKQYTGGFKIILPKAPVISFVLIVVMLVAIFFLF